MAKLVYRNKWVKFLYRSSDGATMDALVSVSSRVAVADFGGCGFSLYQPIKK